MVSGDCRVLGAGIVVRELFAAVSGPEQATEIGDPELHARLAAGCTQVTARLGWEDPVREMEALYNRLAIKTAPGANFRGLE